MSERAVPPTLPELEANLARLLGDARPSPAFVAELERELRASQPIAVSTWPARLSVALGTLALTVVLALALAVIGRWRMPLPSAVSTATAAATPMGGALTLQDDQDCGVRFLRPGEWVLVRASSDCASRFYAAPGSTGSADRLVLQPINYRVVDEQTAGGPGAVAQYAAFQQDSTLDGWTRRVERIWAGIYVTATLEYSAPDARVYAVQQSSVDEIDLVGLKVSQGQPLALMLEARGAFANLDRLRAEHIWDEFPAMVNSLSASGQTAPSGTPVASATVPAGSAHAACLSGVSPVALSALPAATTHAGWKHYVLPLEPLGLDVPPDWQLAVLANDLCLSPQAAPQVALIIRFRGPNDAADIVQAAETAGDVTHRGSASILGQTVVRSLLVYHGKDKAVLYNAGAEIKTPEIALTARLDDFGPDYDAAALPLDVQAIADQIVATLTTQASAPK
jgi:hypothetical protein